MRLLIASDLHGSLDSLRFLCDTAQRLSPDMLVLLGDLVYHGPRNPLPGGYDTRSVLEELDRLNHLPCPVTAVRGNCDAEVDIMLTPFAVSENAWIEADALRIFASSLLANTIASTNAAASAIGPAYITPSIPINSGKIMISGSKKITCRVIDITIPSFAIPIEVKKQEDIG